MNGQELFGVVVRTFGIVIILYGLYPLLNLVVELLQHQHFYFWSMVICAVYVAGGVAVIVRADWIIAFAYRAKTPKG